MPGGKQFFFPPSIQVVKQKMVKTRSILFLSSETALLPREGRGFHYVLAVLWGFATPIRRFLTRGWWTVAISPIIFDQKENASFSSGLNTLSSITTISFAKPMPDYHSCRFPHVISLPKGLLKVKSGHLCTGTILDMDRRSLQPALLGPDLQQCSPSIIWIPKVKSDGSGHKVAESLPCPEVGLLQQCTWQHWGGKPPILMETGSGGKLVSSAAFAAVWRWLLFFTSQVHLGQLFSFQSDAFSKCNTLQIVL